MPILLVKLITHKKVLAQTPVLYTVGLGAIFWNMKSVWAAQCSKGKNKLLGYFWGRFFNSLKLFFPNIAAFALKNQIINFNPECRSSFINQLCIELGLKRDIGIFSLVQIITCQRDSFIHQLTQNMTWVFSGIYVISFLG